MKLIIIVTLLIFFLFDLSHANQPGGLYSVNVIPINQPYNQGTFQSIILFGPEPVLNDGHIIAAERLHDIKIWG